MRKGKIEEAINNIKWLLKESERHSNNAAMGYDEGWYNGECNAYEIVLEILEEVMKDNLNGGFAMKLSKKIIDIVNDNNFIINEVEKQDNDFYVELGQYTPCGEDWWETIWFDGTNEGFIEAVRKRYNDFDVDEEAEMWIGSRGKNGVPSSIKALVKDAEWKEEVLERLAEELEF